MNFLQRFRGALRAARPRHVAHVLNHRRGGESEAMAPNYLDALASTHERPYVFGTELPPDGSTPLLDRLRLSKLTRWMCDNNGLVSYAVETIASYAVPVVAQAATVDPGWNDTAEAYFAEWSEYADYGRRFDFFTLELIACMATDLDGDIAIQAVADDGIKLQIIEGHRIATPPKLARNKLIRDGIQIDATGRLVSYHVSLDDRDYTVVPADEAFLWFEPDPSRPNAYRGVSPIRRGLNDVRDAKDIKGYEKAAQKIHASLAAVIKSIGGVEPVSFGETQPDGTISMPVNGTGSTSTGAVKVTDLIAGTIPVLPEGQELQALETNRPSANVREFLESLAASFVCGLGIPPAFFLDARLTGPNVRAVNGKAERKFARRQRLAKRFVRWTWMRVIADAIARGLLPAHPQWSRITYQTPPRLSIDIGGEEAADLASLQQGACSFAEYSAKRGRDPRSVYRQELSARVAAIEAAQVEAERLGVPVSILLPAYMGQYQIGASGPRRADEDASEAPPADDEEEDPIKEKDSPEEEDDPEKDDGDERESP